MPDYPNNDAFVVRTDHAYTINKKGEANSDGTSLKKVKVREEDKQKGNK